MHRKTGGTAGFPPARTRAPYVWMMGLLAVAGGCSKGLDGPKPAIEAKSGLPIDPGIVCRDQLTTEITVHGAKLSPVPIDVPKDPRIAIPTLTLVRSQELDGKAADGKVVTYSGDPDDETNLSLVTWKSQEEMTFTVSQEVTVDGAAGMIPVGLYDVRVKNPNDEKAEAGGALAVVDKPELTKLTPGVVCLTQGPRELSMTGTTFLEIDGKKPTLAIEGVDAPFTVSTLEGCTKIAHDGLTASYCDAATLSLAQDSVGEGFHRVTLTNPETAACATEETVGLLVVPPPVIDSVNPPVACKLDGNQILQIQGSGFLEVDGKKPRVELGDTVVGVSKLSSCETLQADGVEVKSCTVIELAINTMDFPLGDVTVNVTNPDPAGCSGSASAVFRIAGPPMISSVAPTEICDGVASDLTITGTGFDPAAHVTVDGVDATNVMFVSDTELVATVPAGLSLGSHSVTVTNVGSCTDTQESAIDVDPSPIVFFVDPPVIYSDVPVQITIFTSGLSSTASKVELVHEDGTTSEEVVDFASPSKPNEILADVPAGLKAGKWDVYVTNAGGCPGFLAQGLTISDTLDDSLVTSVSPSFVSPTAPTAVTITGSGFEAIPRVYLTPSGAAAGDARALTAVEVKSGTQLTAIVPGGLTPGEYDLLVVNPDGKVDLLSAGITVTVNEPPVITSVAPGSLPANDTDDVTILGSGFDTAGVEVVLDCDSGGTRSTVLGTAQTPTSTSVVVTFDMSAGTPSAPSAGSVCLVRLTNGDGAFFEFSAFSVTNSSLNLSAWESGTPMTTARRALSLVAGRPTSSSRFLYAIGGDSGVDNDVAAIGASVFASVESAPVDVFGAMGAWSAQRNALPDERTWAGAATIGRFVYVLGGHDGTTATNTLYRAQILDPLAGPEISDLDAELGDGTTGLGGGLYYYRVSALYAADDVSNPGGESLAGELLPVQLPDRDEKIVLTMTWSPVPGAHGYRLYRTPAASTSAGQLELVGEILCGAGANDLCDCGADPTQCQLVDDGTATDANVTPMPAGSLGVWHAVDGARCTSGDCLLSTAREAHATTAIEDPATPGKWYLYAFGGRDAGGAYLDTYEIATVTVAGDGTQTVADFAIAAAPGPTTLTLTSPRAELGVWVMSKSNVRTITDDRVWVYLGGGRTTGDTIVTDMEAGELNADGTFSVFTATNQELKSALAGFGAGAANGQLYTFGGRTSSDGRSAELCSTNNCLPDFAGANAFNSLGAAATDRMYMGATQESAFFFLAGGHNGDNTLSTTQQTVQ